MQLLTIFTPAYNRKHTICRTYESLLRQTDMDFQWLIIDDGSTDGTQEWVLSLSDKIEFCPEMYDWMGRRITEPATSGLSNQDRAQNHSHFKIEVQKPSCAKFSIEYVKKPNGGLYTGYNVAYDLIDTELCVCIDSDDFAADNTVELIKKTWRKHYPSKASKLKSSVLTSKEYCGIIGLDFDMEGKPLGGYFPNDLTECYRSDLFINGIHKADSKEVMRTDLMKRVAPQLGFEGEKNFNPSYMLAQVWDKYPLLVFNENLCNVEYQVGADSMSQGIWKQYVNSPHSYAKHRLMQMGLKRYPYSLKFKSAAHYVSSCIFSKDKEWLKKSPMKLTTLLAAPLGLAFNIVIRYKTR